MSTISEQYDEDTRRQIKALLDFANAGSGCAKIEIAVVGVVDRSARITLPAYMLRKFLKAEAS